MRGVVEGVTVRRVSASAVVRRYVGRPPRSDVVLAVVLAVAAEVEVWGLDIVGPRAVSATFTLLAGLVLAWRRVAPLAVALAVTGLATAQALLGVSPTKPVLPLVIAVVSLYSLGAYDTARAAVIGTAAAITGYSVAITTEAQFDASDFSFMLAFVGASVVAGRALGGARFDAVEQQRRAERLERERQQREQAAIAEERARIARELHDVIGHSVGVMGVQAGAVRRVLPADLAEEREALRSVERTGREAVSEVHRLLGMLRSDDGDPPGFAPQPTVRDLDAVAERLRAAGLTVDLELEGDLASLAPGLDLAAFRIVQEALTNALKHAGRAHVCARVRCDDRNVTIDVTDDGPGSAAGDVGGHGIIGMRERAALYGGELTAGARAQGGYAVHARLPLNSD